MKEVEVKILEINPDKTRKLLLASGAKFIKKVFQRNTIYENKTAKPKGNIVRIRQEGSKITLTAKSPLRIVNGHKLREEIELKIFDADLAKKFLKVLGYSVWGITEANREYYALFNCSVEIIQMPKIPLFLEIEGTEKNILKVAKLLGYSKKDYFPLIVLNHYKIKNKILTF